MTMVRANIMLLCPSHFSRMTVVTLLWSLAPLPLFVADATFAGNLVTRQPSAPRVKCQLPTLLPTDIATTVAKLSPSLIIC